MKRIKMIVPVAMVALAGCEKATESLGSVVSLRSSYRDTEGLIVSSNKVGKINWNDPELKLWYRECGAPFSPIEMVIVEAKGRHLYCKCFDDSDAEQTNKPSAILYHDCDIKEWREVMRVLKTCGMESWSDEYCDPCVCDGTFWHIKIACGTNVVARIDGSNLWPESFGKFLKIKKMALEHPELHKFNCKSK